MKFLFSAAAVFVVGLFCMPRAAQAELCEGVTPVWTTGVYDPATQEAAAFNALRHRRIPDYQYAFMDGYFGVKAPGTVSNNKVLTFELQSPVDITEFRYFSRWQDNGRDGIHINSVEVSFWGSTEFVYLTETACDYDENKTAHYAFLSAGGEVLARNVRAIRINFGTQDNGSAGVEEMELLGTDTNPPVSN